MFQKLTDLYFKDKEWFYFNGYFYRILIFRLLSLKLTSKVIENCICDIINRLVAFLFKQSRCNAKQLIFLSGESLNKEKQENRIFIRCLF